MKTTKPATKNAYRPSTTNFLIAVAITILVYIFISFAEIIKLTLILKIDHENPAGFYSLMLICNAIILTALFLYVAYSRFNLIHKVKEYGALMTAFTFGYIACNYCTLLNLYLMPITLTAFLIVPLAMRRDTFVFNLIFNLLLLATLLLLPEVWSLYNALICFIVGIFTGSLAAYILTRNSKRIAVLYKGLIIAASGTALYALLSAINNVTLFAENYAYILIAMYGQVLIAIGLQPVLEGLFNLVTNSRLIELTDHNSPLIKRLINEAPGTFNHSLAVANFAEICAAAIGENPYLARACAYYHDVGKLKNAVYFSENQSDFNPHNDLLPEVSADIIRKHTVDGLELCRLYRIPKEISKVTLEHHGTLPITVFYIKAKNLTDSPVDAYEYSYHGKTPSSKMTAIIMICDSGEAAIRAMDKPDGEKVDKLLKKIIEDRIVAGQFDNCPISLQDLYQIRRAIVGAYGGLFHKRVKYPEGKQ